MTILAQQFDEIINKRRSVRVYDTNAPFDSQIVVRSIERATLAPNSSNMQLWEFYHITSKEAKAEIAKYCMSQPAAATANELVVFVTRKDKWKERAQWNIDSIITDKSILETSVSSNKDFQELISESDDVSRMKSINHYYTKLMTTLYRSDLFGISSFLKRVYVLWKGMKEPMYREVSDADLRIVVHKSCALAAQTFMLSMAAEGYGTCPMEGFDSKLIKKYLNLPKGAEVNMVIGCGIPKQEGIYGERLRVDFEEVYKKV